MKPTEPLFRAVFESIIRLYARRRPRTCGRGPRTSPVSYPGCRTTRWYINGVLSCRQFLRPRSATRAPLHEAHDPLARGHIHRKAIALAGEQTSHAGEDRQCRAHNHPSSTMNRQNSQRYHGRSSRPAPRALSTTTPASTWTPSRRCLRQCRCG